MRAVQHAIAVLSAEIARLSAQVGCRVIVDEDSVADRRPFVDLGPSGIWSSNHSCRMVQVADGWIAVNLPRESDLDLVPAWIGCTEAAEPWPAILRAARRRPRLDLVMGARLLGLPVCGVGEVHAASPDAPLRRMGAGGGRLGGGPFKVVDLSAMWAGPLCGSILAEAGMTVTKIESISRPDAARDASPAFFERLNGSKTHAVIDFADRAGLGEMIAGADVVITSARPRAFDQLGLSPKALFSRNPRLTWVAISGYGWLGEGADRVAFGDDAAAAGGLVRSTPGGAPRFAGDALADPLTGLAAAAGALQAIRQGGGLLVDAALAVTGAGVAARYAATGARRAA